MGGVLMFSRFPPGGKAFGSATRLAAMLDWLHGQGLEVHFVSLARRRRREPAAGALPKAITSFHHLDVQSSCTPGPLPAPWQHLAKPRALARLWSWTGWNPWQTDLTTPLTQLLEQTQASIVWIDHSDLVPLLVHLPAGRKLLKVVDTHDVMHERDATLVAASLPTECGVSASEEQELLDRSDLVLAIQDREREALQRLLPRKRVITVGHAIEATPQPCLEPDLCFVGSKYRVNELSLLTFLQRAWPQIRARCPASCLEVVGGVGECASIVAAARSDRRIVIRGTIGDTAAIYRGPAAVVCPMWIGSGLKIKLVEALAHGKAVVASPVAAQGLEEGANRAFVLAKEPEDFVQPVVELLKGDSARRAWERSALEFARRKFNQAAVWTDMQDALRELCDERLDGRLGRAA